jgi:hypothetical protein
MTGNEKRKTKENVSNLHEILTITTRRKRKNNKEKVREGNPEDENKNLLALHPKQISQVLSTPIRLISPKVG